jgi:tetratricopeptide (TPR) repeat protein
VPSLFQRIARNKFPLFLIVSTAVILTGMYFLNDIVLTVRMTELDGFLEQINREASKVDELGMLSKFKLHLALYNREIDDKKFDEEELSTVYLATSYEVRNKVSMTKYAGVSEPIIWIINLIRKVTGKAAIQTVIANPSDMDLALAYYFEMNKNFKHALSIYEKAVSRITEDRVPIVLLHEGYCRSLIGDYDEAKSIFISIIKKYNNENIAITAALMLQYLETIRSEVTKVKASTDSDITKSEKLYRLIAYEDAIEVLKKIQPQNKKETDQIAFLNARCLEETGKTEESVKMYQGIIRSDRGSDAAKAANRRLLVMASVDENGEKMKELAKKNNELIRDSDFDSLLVTSDKVDTNKEKLDPAEKAKITDEIENDKKNEQALKGDSAMDSGSADTRDLDTFIAETIESIDAEEGKATAEQTTIEPKASENPTFPPAPVPTSIRETPLPPAKLTSAPTPEATRTPTSEPSPATAPTPAKPYSKDFKDSKGIIYKTEMYNANGKLDAIKYMDSKGNINKVEMYDEKGNLAKTIMYEFDKNGNPTKIKEYDGKGNLIDDR